MSNAAPPGFNGEIRVVFIVREYEKTRNFYEQYLGLEIFNEWDRAEDDKGVIYRLGQTQLEILKGTQTPHAEGFYVYMEVADVDALWARVSGSADVVDPIATQEWKHRNFSIRDPNGFKLKFFSKL